MKKIFDKHFKVIANNGGNPQMYPVKESFQWALENSVDMLSLYLYVTKDGIIIAAPMEKLQEYSNLEGEVSDYTYDEIMKSVLNNDKMESPLDSFLTIDEILRDYKVLPINIQLIKFTIKDTKKICEIMKQHDITDNIIVCAVESKVIKLLRRLLPDVATACSLGEIMVIFALFRSGLLGLKKTYKADCLQIPEKIGTSYIANSGLVRMVQKRGLKVYVWGVNSEKVFKRVKNTTADGFFTNDYFMIKNLLKE